MDHRLRCNDLEIKIGISHCRKYLKYDKPKPNSRYIAHDGILMKFKCQIMNHSVTYTLIYSCDLAIMPLSVNWCVISIVIDINCYQCTRLQLLRKAGRRIMDNRDK